MDEEKLLQSAQALYKFMYKHSGMLHRSCVDVVCAFLRGKMTREEVLSLCGVYYYDLSVCSTAREKKVKEWESPENYIFLKKYGSYFDLNNPNFTTKTELELYLEEHKEEVEACKYEPKIVVTEKDIKGVLKRIARDYYVNEGCKRRFYDSDNARHASYLIMSFFNATKYTEERHRKKSQRYTVSRDEDKKRFYRSAKGRLACLPLYKLKKYIKQGRIVEDHGELQAKEDIPDGVYIRVGSYIEKHFPKIPKENKEALQRAFEEIRPCHMIIDRDFKKAYDPYYSNHQDTDGDKASNYSCMSGAGSMAQQFYGGIHGCKVVRWETDKGEQVGRCIMYEYNGQRHFVRIYGLYDYHRTMINMLTNEMKPNDLFGRDCVISGMKLETDWTGDTRTMYLDGNGYGISEVSTEDGTKWVVGTCYDYDCKSTDHDPLDCCEEDMCTCDNCGERINSDDGYWINDEFYCCSDCAHEAGYYYCEYCDDWGREDDGYWIDDNFYCCDDCAEAAGYERCRNCDEWHDKDDMIEINDEYYCCEDCANNDGYFCCLHCGDWSHSDNSETVVTEDGEYCCADCAERDGWTKVGEEWRWKEDVEEVKETEEPKEVVNED